MLYFYSGTDSERMREKLDVAIHKDAKGKEVLRITDAHSIFDLQTALQGPGLFGDSRVVVLDGVVSSEEMYDVVNDRLKELRDSKEVFYIVEGALDAATRKSIEKYAEKSERFDVAKGKQPETVFALANALQGGKKKELWVGYQREIVSGKSPEAIHGVLFWAAKQQLLRRTDERSRKLVADLAELPHEARRNGFDLEYALENFMLSIA